MSALGFLNSSEYQLYNRKVAKQLGSIHAAIFLSELVNRYEYHIDQGGEQSILLHQGQEWFYYTHDKGEERLAMTRREQDTAVKLLVKAGLISKMIKGVPGKRYFTLHQDKILDLFDLSKKHSRMAESAKLDCTNPPNCNGGIRQTHHIYKEPNKEPKERDRQTHDKSCCARADSSSSDKLKLGSDKLVHLTENQHAALSESIGQSRLDELIEELNDYIASTGKRYKCHAATLRSWNRRKGKETSRSTRQGKLVIKADKNDDGWKPKKATLEDL